MEWLPSRMSAGPKGLLGCDGRLTGQDPCTVSSVHLAVSSAMLGRWDLAQCAMNSAEMTRCTVQTFLKPQTLRFLPHYRITIARMYELQCSVIWYNPVILHCIVGLSSLWYTANQCIGRFPTQDAMQCNDVMHSNKESDILLQCTGIESRATQCIALSGFLTLGRHIPLVTAPAV